MRILATRKGHRVECIDRGTRRPLTVDELIEFRAAQAKAELTRMASTKRLLIRGGPIPAAGVIERAERW